MGAFKRDREHESSDIDGSKARRPLLLPSGGTRKRVLVVEDNPGFRSALTTGLRSSGYAAAEATWIAVRQGWVRE